MKVKLKTNTRLKKFSKVTFGTIKHIYEFELKELKKPLEARMIRDSLYVNIPSKDGKPKFYIYICGAKDIWEEVIEQKESAQK